MARILVVDDDAVLRGLIRTILDAEGHEVAEASNGLDALTALEAARAGGDVPDVVLVDLMMPVMGGWELLLEMHARDLRRLTRVVVVSSLCDDATILRGRQAGALAHVSKPFEPDELVAIVEYALTEAPERALERHGRLDDLLRHILAIDAIVA